MRSLLPGDGWRGSGEGHWRKGRGSGQRANGGADASAGFFFFFCLFITRVRPIRSWRDYLQSVSCPQSAQWRLVASAPLPSAQACPKKM